jgi:heterodisulfide reductase subunit B
MEYTFYPGCSLEASAKPYDLSTRAVCAALGIKLTELEDWNCCGATAYMSVRELKSFAISARNLALAEPLGNDILTACPACYLVLNKTYHYCQEDKALREKLTGALSAAGLPFENKVRVRHILDVVHNDVGEARVREKVVRPLAGLKVAPYYGCQISRPLAEFDDAEFPMTMDAILKWAGAQVLDYPLKAKCCGGMMMSTEERVSLELVKKLLDLAYERGADCIAVACPMCQVNLDAYQDRVSKLNGRTYAMPTVFFTQLLGMAFGLPEGQLGLRMGITPTDSVLAKVGA